MRTLIAASLVLAAAAACSDDDAVSDATQPAVTSAETTQAPDTTVGATTPRATAGATTPTTTAGTTAPPVTSADSTVPDPTTPGPESPDGPFDPGQDWAVDRPAAHGIDAERLGDARRYAFAEGRNTQGVVVVHDGAIVAEWYDTADGAGRDSWAASWSMGKSFTSALIGIAIDEGLIPSVDEPMTTWYPSWKGTEREDITLGDVLQMSSGLDWVESYDPAAIEESDIIQMVLFQENQLRYASQRPALNPAGEVWSYSSGDTMLMSGVIEQVTGMTTEQYADEKIFEPIGIDQVEWWQDAREHTLTYCCLDTTTRDFARFGWLYLNDGAWGDHQVVPADWVAESLEQAPTYEGYGYQWWLTGNTEDRLPGDLYSARGHDGQYIYVIPSLDLVVVRNGTYVKYDGEPIADPNLFGKYPSSGLVEGQGTSPPETGWDDVEFLTPIIDSLPSD